MANFAYVGGHLIAEGHGHNEAALRAGVAVALSGRAASQMLGETAILSEAWYSDAGGFGHDCAAHQDVNREEWGAYCGTFRAVTVASGIPEPVAGVNRVA